MLLSVEPLGWDEELFGGPWPSCHCLALKLAVPSSHRRLGANSRDYTATMLVSCGPNIANHLKLGEGQCDGPVLLLLLLLLCHVCVNSILIP